MNEGDRVAQLILERIYTPEVVEVAELEDSVRGAGGFGSTGGFGGEKLTTTVSLDGASDAPAPAPAPAPAVEVRVATGTNGEGKDVEMQENGQKSSS